MLIDYQVAKDFIGPVISGIAATLSIVFFVKTNRLSGRMGDRSIYMDGQKFLIEICKQLISEPILWCIYDDHVFEEDKPKLNDRAVKAKLEAFAHLHLNMFEIVLAEAPKPGSGKRANQSNVWISYFHDTLKRCSLVQKVLAEPSSANIWSRKLLDQFDHWKDIK